MRKKKAVADAKLQAIEQSIREEGNSFGPEQFEIEDARSRTFPKIVCWERDKYCTSLHCESFTRVSKNQSL